MSEKKSYKDMKSIDPPDEPMHRGSCKHHNKHKPYTLTYQYKWYPPSMVDKILGPLVYTKHYRTEAEARAVLDKLMRENDTLCAKYGVHRVLIWDISKKGE